MTDATLRPKRFAYLDFLRILAAFLVIVNHTNSLVFQKLTPADGTWWLSIAWYYLSKTAVPLFVMISGACLLPRRDSYRRAFGRFARVLAVLVLFSYVYYVLGLMQTGWSWGQAVNLPAFLSSIWAQRITDSFWYLYFYLGLMVMLPMLQRLASAMDRQDLLYFMAVSFGVYAAWPLVTHYLPGLALPAYFDVPVFSVFVGLFFAGHYVHTVTRQPRPSLSALVIVLSVGASVLLTYLEVGRVAAGAKYWFMDERTAPSLFVVACSLAIMLLSRGLFAAREPLGEKVNRRWATAGACSFGIYLLQDLVIAQTRYRFFTPLRGAINPFLAGLCWSLGVFAVAFAVAWLLKRVPLLRKLL